jgi:sortase (surface protein transpeptidase)
VTLVTCYPFYFVGSAPLRYIVHASATASGNTENGRKALTSTQRAGLAGTPKT